jgi:hypothetical protein
VQKLISEQLQETNVQLLLLLLLLLSFSLHTYSAACLAAIPRSPFLQLESD